jgi:tripartite-type tricarboxylate transporter receptor subunit TctC
MVSRQATIVLGAALLLVLAGCGRPADYPSRPLTMIVPWAAGGGTDAVARVVASLMEKELGRPVNVVNRTGGSGVVGHQAIAAAPPDGYTIGMITAEIAMMRHQGLTDLSGSAFAPLGLVNFDAAAIQVRAGSPHRSLADLMLAIRSNPGKLKASGTARGGIWHLALAGLLDEQRLPPDSVVWIPTSGNAAALLDLVAGGVDFVVGSHPEGRSLIDGGRVRSLAILDEKPSALYPAVPTARDEMSVTWTLGTWRGIAAPKSLPPEIEQRLRDAVRKACEGGEYREFMAARGFGVRWAEPDEFARFIGDADERMGAVMKTVGLAK